MTASIARASDLRLVDRDDIGPHYAITLRVWRERMFSTLDTIRAMGYGDDFIRMWEFYFCYCEAGFAEHALGDVQMLLVKPEYRPGKLRTG